MPWNTSQGRRVLEGAEARLFAVAIPTIIDFFQDQFCDEGEIPRLNYGEPLICGRFEDLHTREQFAVLENVAISLLTHNSAEVPVLDEYNEGAIYYIYKWLMSQFSGGELEDVIANWGPYVVAAYDECFPPEDKDESKDESDVDDYCLRVNMKCLKTGVWLRAIEELSDRILWDLDFEMYASFGSDLVPGFILRRADISNQYFHAPIH